MRGASRRAKSLRDRVTTHRERLRGKGLRPIQIWVPDVESRAFKQKAHSQAVAVSNSPYADEDQCFVDAISGWDAE